MFNLSVILGKEKVGQKPYEVGSKNHGDNILGASKDCGDGLLTEGAMKDRLTDFSGRGASNHTC